MNEENRYLNNEEETSLDKVEDLHVPAFTAETNTADLVAPSQYMSEQHLEVNGEVVSEEALVFSPEMITEWELLNPEDKAESIELVQEAAFLANVSETGNIAAEKAAKISTLGTAFALAETSTSEGEADVDASSQVTKESFWRRTINTLYETAGKGARAAAIAATLGVATLAPVKSAEAGMLDQFNVSQVINRVDRAMNGQRNLQNIKQQQENIQMRIEQLERQKAQLIRQTSSHTRVDQIRNTGENDVRNAQIEANYEAQKANIEARLANIDAREAQVDAQYESSRIGKAPDVQMEINYKAQKANFKAERAQIKAQEVSIDTQHKVNQIEESSRVQDTDANIGERGDNLSDNISQINMQEENLRADYNRLNLEKTRTLWETTKGVVGQ